MTNPTDFDATDPGATPAEAVALPAAQAAPRPPAQARNPLHGLTLERIVTELAAHYGWDGLAEQVPLRCFSVDPSVKSSLKLLRQTPWAREKVEGLYLFMLREQRRAAQGRGA
ncbi:MAG: VF530 family DNA-binding protein [Leptothrix sp. (in: b-proteobacteria)]